MSLCRVAYFDGTGRRVELSTAQRDRLMLSDRGVRREVVRASKKYGPHGTLVLLDAPDVPEMCHRAPS